MGASQETSDWEIGEIIVFNKKLTSDEEEKIVSYLENTYYGTDGFEPVGNNRTLRLTRKNLKLSEVYSAMYPNSRDIEYLNQTDYNNIVNLNLSSVNIQDISNVTVKNSDLTSRLINDTSYTNILGQAKGYTQSTFDEIRGGGVGRGLSNFRGSRAGGGSVSVDITGTEITSYNSYKVHEFKYDSNNNTSGQTIYTLTVRGKITADFLMIAGGGGGGSPSSASGTSGGNSWEPGGGGAGELIYQTNIEFKAGTYLFKVGDGGENRVNTSNNNGPTGYDTSIIGGQLNNTYNSSINGFIANGGQSGSTYASNSYNTFTPKGGSGGGNAHNTGNASWASTPESGTLTYNDYSSFNPSSTPNEVGYFGNKGGIDNAGGNWGGGGGGAGGIPSSASGGVGKQYSIRDGSTLVYYAGGGACANLNGIGGQGGGGDGGTNSVRAGGVGTPHTGSGGGAGYGTEHGGKGGSGLIIFRYK